MFNRGHAVATASEACPKCGFGEVLADSCPRCRVRVSNYRTYLAIRDGGGGALARRAWFPRLRPLRTSRRPAPSAGQRSIYEELILGRIYRELRYPATARGVYLVLLGFDVTPAGRASALSLSVNPANAQVTESVRAALNRAQPFPPPPSGGDGKAHHVSLALTVNI
jgi:hypothetical protein